MPLDKKTLSFLHHLQTAYQPDENSIQYLSAHLPEWVKQYKQLYQQLFEQIKREKARSKAVKTALPAFSEDLRLRLSDQLPEQDLIKILTEAVLLSHLLGDEKWQHLLQQNHLDGLKEVVHSLHASWNELQAIQTLRDIKEEVESALPVVLHSVIWQYITHRQQHKTHFPTIPQQAGTPLVGYLNYLLKRKTGFSLNDQEIQVLWLNTLENHWEQSILRLIEPDLQEQALAERIISCQTSFLDFGFAFGHKNNNTSYLHWQDPLTTPGQGIQTSLFSPVPKKNNLTDQLRERPFSVIGLDLRQPLPPYRYARRSVPNLDQAILAAYQQLGIEDISLDTSKRLLSWSLEKLGEQGILLVFVERKRIEKAESLPFRRFLENTFQEIYVLDMADQTEDGAALLYLVKKKGTAPQKAIVLYAQLGIKDLLEHTKDFESLNWQKVQTEQQNYWIALPDSDFFKLYPLFGTDKALFKRQATGIESFVDEWLMDDDVKLLEKKVKYFLKQYNRASGKGKEEPEPDIKWPENLKRMAQEGLPLSFDKQKIHKIQIKPFVYAFVYAEEKLLLHNDAVAPAMLYASDLKKVFPLHQIWHTRFADSYFAYPLNNTELQKKTDENISDTALKHFRTHYQKRTKEFDQNFIVFPPENITRILDKMESVSRDLPVIRKYPNQISHLLEEARHFTSDVELLTPPYEKIDEFKRKVLLLEKDAIERKIIYQKVKGYIEELKQQLATLTREHDEALKDYEAVNKENIFYYTFAILHHPNYRKKYSVFLAKELPRIPMLPKFRQWVQWGKDLFQAHQAQTESENVSLKLQVKEEIHDEMISKAFTYELDRARSLILLKEQFLQITLSNIPEEAWNYQLEERHPFTYYLDYLCRRPDRNRKIRAQFTQTRLADKAQIIANLKHLCSLSFRLAALKNEMQKVHF